MIHFTVEYCTTKAAFRTKPLKQIKLNLDRIKKQFETIIDTPLVLLVKEEDEIVVHKFGELLFKTIKDEEKIKRIAEKLYIAGTEKDSL